MVGGILLIIKGSSLTSCGFSMMLYAVMAKKYVSAVPAPIRAIAMAVRSIFTL